MGKAYPPQNAPLKDDGFERASMGDDIFQDAILNDDFRAHENVVCSGQNCNIRRNVWRRSFWWDLNAGFPCGCFHRLASKKKGLSKQPLMLIESVAPEKVRSYLAPWPFLSKLGETSTVGRPTLW